MLCVEPVTLSCARPIMPSLPARLCATGRFTKTWLSSAPPASTTPATVSRALRSRYFNSNGAPSVSLNWRATLRPMRQRAKSSRDAIHSPSRFHVGASLAVSSSHVPATTTGVFAARAMTYRYGAAATTDDVRVCAIACITASSPISTGTAAAASAAFALCPGETMTFAPRVRNSCVSWCSTPRLRLMSAEITAAPLTSATMATARRPRLPRSSFHSRRANISLAPQDGRGIEMRGTPQGNQAAGDRYDRRETQDHGQENNAERRGDAENTLAQNSREACAEYESERAACNREHELLCEKNSGDQSVGCADRFHDADLIAAFEYRRRRRGSNGECRGRECGEGHN